MRTTATFETSKIKQLDELLIPQKKVFKGIAERKGHPIVLKCRWERRVIISEGSGFSSRFTNSVGVKIKCYHETSEISP